MIIYTSVVLSYQEVGGLISEHGVVLLDMDTCLAVSRKYL